MGLAMSASSRDMVCAFPVPGNLPCHRRVCADVLRTTVVRSPEDAAALKEGAYDYVILCVKALPDVYDLASVIDSVVTPQHTCILINTTNSLGVESAIEERFPTNVVLSLVCGAELVQLGGSEFEHKGSTEVWVGPANKNSEIPPSIQEDMAQALAMTLSTGQVDCKVSNNIRQQQFERVIGYVAHFLPLLKKMLTIL
jgi:ketopantoate reductase